MNYSKNNATSFLLISRLILKNIICTKIKFVPYIRKLPNHFSFLLFVIDLFKK